MPELSRQTRGTILYLVDEYRHEMRKVLDGYLTIPPPSYPMTKAIAEVTERYQARCQNLGIEWDDIQAVLDADLGLSTPNIIRVKDLTN